MKDNAVLRVVAKIIVPVILVFSLYVQFHGDYGPGGGFQMSTLQPTADAHATKRAVRIRNPPPGPAKCSPAGWNY